MICMCIYPYYGVGGACQAFSERPSAAGMPKPFIWKAKYGQVCESQCVPCPVFLLNCGRISLASAGLVSDTSEHSGMLLLLLCSCTQFQHGQKSTTHLKYDVPMLCVSSICQLMTCDNSQH